MEGFITHGGTPDGSFDFFKLLNNALFVGKAIAYITQTLVGDTFVVSYPSLYQEYLRHQRADQGRTQTYRLYVVYNRNPWIAILPICLLVGTAGTLFLCLGSF